MIEIQFTFFCDYRVRAPAGRALSRQPDTHGKASAKRGSWFSTHYVLNGQYVLK